MSGSATCGGCDTRWHQRGNVTGHCSGCHRTFAGVGAFDAHQRVVDGRNVCVDPGELMTGADHKQPGQPRFRAVLDSEGATVWRTTHERPIGTYGDRNPR